LIMRLDGRKYGENRQTRNPARMTDISHRGCHIHASRTDERVCAPFLGVKDVKGSVYMYHKSRC
jgi:hypothetical protein